MKTLCQQRARAHVKLKKRTQRALENPKFSLSFLIITIKTKTKPWGLKSGVHEIIE